nr:MAG TPA: hypothetical protein [Caudoviricetes sp.]
MRGARGAGGPVTYCRAVTRDPKIPKPTHILCTPCIRKGPNAHNPPLLPKSPTHTPMSCNMYAICDHVC